MTERELNAARELKDEIERQERKIETLRRSMGSIVPTRDGQPVPKGQGSPVERLIERLLEAEAELRLKRSELDAAKVSLIEKICAEDLKESERKVLLLRYVSCMRFRDISFDLGLSDARVYRLHSDGVKKIVEE